MLVQHAAWVLTAALVLSVAYEVWRVTAHADESEHDTWRAFATGDLPLYVVTVVVIVLLHLEVVGAVVVGLLFSVAVIGVSTFVYNPRIMLDRRPGTVDWVEDLAYTGLHYVAAALLLYEVLGFTLTRG